MTIGGNFVPINIKEHMLSYCQQQPTIEIRQRDWEVPKRDIPNAIPIAALLNAWTRFVKNIRNYDIYHRLSR